MKQKIITIVAVFLLLVSISIVYAHSATQKTTTEKTTSINNFEEMDEIHELMTQNLEPELKEQMEIRKSICHGG